MAQLHMENAAEYTEKQIHSKLAIAGLAEV